MKNFGLTAVVVVISAGAAFSQTEKGTFMVGGSMSIRSSNNDGLNSYGYSISPSVSYFIINRLAAGINAQYSIGVSSGSGFVNHRERWITLGPTVRYYFPIAPNWAVFTQVDYSYQWQKFAYEDQGVTNVNYATNSSSKLGAGITYFIAGNVGVEGLLSTPLGESGTSLNFRVNLQVYINKAGANNQ